MELHLTIRIGNDGMTSGKDLAEALTEAARNVRYLGAEPVPEPVSAQRIGDRNGNTVGSWWIEGER